jgi:hypothetical protein
MWVTLSTKVPRYDQPLLRGKGNPKKMQVKPKAIATRAYALFIRGI